MLDDRPVLKERLLACAVFGAIAVGVVAASDLMITGGFDFPSAERDALADTPNYFQIAAEAWSENWTPEAQVRPAAWTGAAPPEAHYTSYDYEPQTLVGAADEQALQFDRYQAPSEEELRREIAELYAALPSNDETNADDAEVHEPGYGDESYVEAAPTNEKGEFSASGNASPW
ncbi:hypothetical protein [Vitreimonas sp.]|uniref:hypothetical protein n=1 Tax=Vitreimonas sp. TaxID=3069702 RepID=UPI002ED9B929